MAEKFNYVKRGYDPQEVDAYMSGLEEKIDDYRKKDLAITHAILSAQIAADNIVKNAELRAEDITSGAIRQLKNISESIVKQRALLNQFTDDYQALIKKHLTDFEDTQVNILHQELDRLEKYTGSLASCEEQQPDSPQLLLAAEEATTEE